MMTAAAPPVLLRAWLGLTARFPSLVLRPVLKAHARKGADPARIGERHGHATLPRPAGRLIWVHAPSVGEFMASRDLIAGLAIALPETTILVTTVTATGAAALARANLPCVIHQFLPADTPASVDSFLDHWQPVMAVLVEADIWPHLVCRTAARGIRLVLVNARPSRTRQRLPRTLGTLLAHFSLITAQDATVAAGLVALGLPPDRVHAVGDLKADALPLPDMPAERHALAQAFGQRPLWSAVSTHEADETPVLQAHRDVIQHYPAAAVVLVPRYPERAAPIRDTCQRLGLPVAQRSLGEAPTGSTAVYLADTLGETGLFFRLSPIVFLGGSFGSEGGHNPYEPLRLGAATIHGPGVRHFGPAYATLDAAGAAVRVTDAASLGSAVARWIGQPADLGRAVAAGARLLGDMQGARDRTLDLLLALVGRED